MSDLEQLQRARRAFWRRPPAEVANLAASRAIMHPAGPTLYAEAETRLMTELLYTFYAAFQAGSLAAPAVQASLEPILAYFSERLAGWYGLKEAASMVEHTRRQISASDSDQLDQALQELILYAGRLNLWIDLLIPWNDINDLMRRHHDRIDHH